jgi:FkbM family methyltransferase
MRNIYLDIGSYDGDTFKLFMEKYPNAASYKAYCFEPNRFLAFHYEKLNCEHVKAAAWTHDGNIRFYIAEKYIASTVMPNKHGRIKIFNKIVKNMVPCVDFSSWLEKNVTQEDFVVCKIDIEGAEYDVLEKVVKDNNLNLIKKLYVDWHCNKLGGFDKSRHDKLVETLVNHGSYNHKKTFCGEKKILDVY